MKMRRTVKEEEEDVEEAFEGSRNDVLHWPALLLAAVKLVATSNILLHILGFWRGISM